MDFSGDVHCWMVSPTLDLSLLIFTELHKQFKLLQLLQHWLTLACRGHFAMLTYGYWNLPYWPLEFLQYSIALFRSSVNVFSHLIENCVYTSQEMLISERQTFLMYPSYCCYMYHHWAFQSTFLYCQFCLLYCISWSRSDFEWYCLPIKSLMCAPARLMKDPICVIHWVLKFHLCLPLKLSSFTKWPIFHH